ncbi:anti-sigma factor antagonist [Streptomyces sp. NPDC005496]|uniref:anti-sigma factor antagonist n=1 Tax=Streptomyces sp. NPDC005496 TaxID=3364716 RepID=UPI0036A6AA39
MQQRAHPAQLMSGDGHVSAGPASPPRAGGPPQLTVRAVPAGDRTVVTVRGEIDMDTEEMLEHRLGAALAGSAGGIDLDMGGVAFCDCSGLNVLLRLRRQALEEGGTVVVRTAGVAVHRLLSITGAVPLFTCAGEGEGPDRSGDAYAPAGAAHPAGGEPEGTPEPVVRDEGPGAARPEGGEPEPMPEPVIRDAEPGVTRPVSGKPMPGPAAADAVAHADVRGGDAGTRADTAPASGDVRKSGSGVGQEPSVELRQLRRAMRARPVIDMARGILMASFGLSAEAAWSVLVSVSRNTDTELHDVAGDLVDAITADALPERVRRQLMTAVAKVHVPVAARGGVG